MAEKKKNEKTEIIEADKNLEHVDLEQIMGSSYIDYSMSVIVARAIPDVRDGMKPVQRRIMYSMYRMGLTHNTAYKKCATTVGDVLGHYHPHGDSSVYDALARMAQDFSMRYPLIDGHGNFGSMDGDPPAAYRYTESRLSKAAEELMRDIDKDTIDWTENFDGSEKEPTVLPSRLPNLLINGASGIAVGMSCNIPSHNLGEIIDASVKIIDDELKDKETTVDDLLSVVKGPDFPTGGLILGDSWKDVYKTGHGSITMQATYEIENVGRKQNLVFTSVPYQVNKAEMTTKIAKYSKEHRLDVSDVRDESNRDGIRIVVELKKNAVPEIVLNHLLQHTSLRTTFPANMLCIVDGQPRTLNLLQMLDYYLEHQKDVVGRRTAYEKKKAENRKHIVEGLILATDHIDEIISIIRDSNDVESAKEALMSSFGFDDIQAQTILDMRLKALTGLERQKLEDEWLELTKTIADCDRILSDPKELLKVIKSELKALKRKYADPRRTGHQLDYSEINMEDLIEDDPCVIIRTHMGYLKRMSPDAFRTQKKGGMGLKVATVQDDYVEDMISTHLHADLLFFTNYGRIYTFKAWQIAETSRKARGTALAGLLTKMQDGEFVTGMVAKEAKEDDTYLMMATKNGVVKRVSLDDIGNVRASGLKMIKLDEGDEVCNSLVVKEDDTVMIITRNGYCSAYAVSTVRPMGRTARGVIGISLGKNDQVVSIQKKEDGREILLITEKAYVKRVSCDSFRVHKNRKTRGVLCIKAQAHETIGKVSRAFLINDIDDNLIVTMNNGQVLKTPISSLPVYTRQAMGTRALNLSKNPTAVVADVVEAPKEEVQNEDDTDVPEGDDLMEQTESSGLNINNEEES